MDLGVTIFLTDRTIGPVELASELEERGFESLWVPEHSHIPVEHSPFPGGGELPDEYQRCLDPFVALTAAATVTSRLRVATGVCLVAQHDPIDLAKQVASLDHLSNGRFVFGIGYGWNVPECEDHGVAFDQRRDFVRESVLAMQRLWSEETAAFDGEHVRFPASRAWPKPVQQPRPPILLGAALGPRTLAAIAEYTDGWLPIGGRGLGEAVPALRTAFADAGRDPDELRLTVYGTVDPDAEKLRYFAANGVQRAVLYLPPAGPETIIPMLDRYAPLVAELADA